MILFQAGLTTAAGIAGGTIALLTTAATVGSVFAAVALFACPMAAAGLVGYALFHLSDCGECFPHPDGVGEMMLYSFWNVIAYPLAAVVVLCAAVALGVSELIIVPFLITVAIVGGLFLVLPIIAMGVHFCVKE